MGIELEFTFSCHPGYSPVGGMGDPPSRLCSPPCSPQKFPENNRENNSLLSSNNSLLFKTPFSQPPRENLVIPAMVLVKKHRNLSKVSW